MVERKKVFHFLRIYLKNYEAVTKDYLLVNFKYCDASFKGSMYF